MNTEKNQSVRNWTRALLACMLLWCLSSCIFLPSLERKPGEEETLFQKIIELSEARVYEDAITACQEFLEAFPTSKTTDVVLLKLGEAFEGLLKPGYYQPVEEGVPAEEAKKQFMKKYSRYECWIDTPCGVQYNLSHYRQMMERFPESNYADEGEYHLIAWSCDYKGLPEGPLGEIAQIEKVLQKYPTSSLKQEMYYKIGYRFHVLYEMMAFSPQQNLRDPAKAREYKDKAFYSYRMALKQPMQSKFAKKAWEDLGRLEDGKRMYITE